MDVNIYTGGGGEMCKMQKPERLLAAQARRDCNVGLFIYRFRTLIFGNTHLLDTLIRSVSICQVTVTTDGAIKTSGKLDGALITFSQKSMKWLIDLKAPPPKTYTAGSVVTRVSFKTHRHSSSRYNRSFGTM